MSSDSGYLYVGLDIHSKTVVYCVKHADGKVVMSGTVAATRSCLQSWASEIPGVWVGVMEATLFTGWIYDFLRPFAQELKVGNPQRLAAISTAKKKSDSIDAAMLADLLRCDMIPECYMLPRELRELRRVLRYRNFLVREAVRMKNKTSSLLMESGAEYDRKRLHGRKYFAALLDNLEDVPASVISLLKMTRSNGDIFQAGQKQLLAALESHPLLSKRVALLTTIPGVGLVTALTWALEVGDPHRFSSIRKAVSYAGLCSALKSSAGRERRSPLSKQRNSNLRWVLIEAAKVATRWNPGLLEVRERELSRGSHKNQATISVARKLVAYLFSVDKNQRPFEQRSAA